MVRGRLADRIYYTRNKRLATSNGNIAAAARQSATAAVGKEPASIKSREMELKFLISVKDANKIARLDWLKGKQRGRATIKNLRATYFDTPELELLDARVAFRIRKEGRRWVQCVKTPERPSEGAFTRREWETFVPRPEPDVSVFEDAETLKALPIATADRLQPAFETIVKRRRRLIEMAPGQMVALDMDRGVIKSGDKTEDVCELEMELVEGGPVAVFQLALKLVEIVPLRLSSATKAQRGYRLLTGERPNWVKAAKPVLPKGVTAENGLGAVVRHCIGHLRANEQVAVNRGHVEGVHQMRVASRRLRSALGIYKKLLPPEQYNHFDGELKWLINAMGPARDWDVFLDETLAPMANLPYGAKALDGLRQAAADARDQGYALVAETLNSTRYGRLLLELAQWVETRGWRDQPVSEWSAMLFAPAAVLAREVLNKRHKRLKREGRHFKTLSPEDRHRLRIDVKKLRYATEFFSSLFPGGTNKKYSAALAVLQDGLGKLNDVAVAQEGLKTLVEGAAKAGRENLNLAAGMVIGWQGHVANGEMEKLVKDWESFNARKPFWKD